MTTTKIRSIIATLTATFAVSVAVAPVAQAQVFRPDVMKRKAQVCRDLQTLYEGTIEGAVQIDGNPDGVNPSDTAAAESDQAANKHRAHGQKAGCGWAA